MSRFIPGIFLIQLATVALVFALIQSRFEGYQVLAICILGLIINVLTAFWFAAISRDLQKDALAEAKESFVRDRENILLDSERQKIEILKESHEKIVKETNRAHGTANLKVGAIFTAALGAGALMLFTQFVTLGLATLVAAGGVLTGYIVRARQDYLANKRARDQLMYGSSRPLEMIEVIPKNHESGTSEHQSSSPK